MNNVWLSVNQYKNQYCATTHEGCYALNIKYYANRVSMPETDFEQAYEMAKEAFFNRAELITYAFGFKGYAIGGRSGGWLMPINDSLDVIKAPNDDYVSFEDHIIEQNMYVLFNMITEQFGNIKKILEFSQNIEEFVNTIERYMEI